MARKRISDATRRKVVEDCEAGLSKKKVAEKHGISVTSVTRIVKEQGGGSPAPEPARKEPDTPDVQKKLSDVERRIRDLEEKILYLEARKQGKGTRV
ncbi:MAG: helix-turn-helix domain-containing protein [Deltaproteobacteria bacterium]|nr:helix-turn-helix domain-containing protein [Deltaproteobacteria bacterium]